MADNIDLTDHRVAAPQISQPPQMAIPIGKDFAPVPCIAADRCAIMSKDGAIVLVLRVGSFGAFRLLTPREAREWAADLLRVADAIDGGSGKQ